MLSFRQTVTQFVAGFPMVGTCHRWICLITAAAMLLPGCRTTTFESLPQVSAPSLVEVPSEIDLDEPNSEDYDPYVVTATSEPLVVTDESEPAYWELSLEHAVQMAAENSQVMRELGGLIVRAPMTIRTPQDPAITQTDPRFGVEAALSQFDAVFDYNALFEKNHRAVNNVFLGGGTRILHQDAYAFQAQLSKRAATGAEFSITNNTDYDSNNSPGNRFYSSWNTNIETAVRQPLLQGGGVDFNRIYGPAGIPGQPSGVLLARVNTDQSVADFELGVRNYLSDVENAYWDLYFAYRELDAKKAARDKALETWRRIHERSKDGRRGGEAQYEAQVREQYFRFQEEVQNSLSGRLIEGTRTNSGITGGTFRATGGVQVAERRLRLMIGAPISDGRLIRPADEPQMARVNFDWSLTLAESLARRPELRRQKWLIKRRELELLGSRNYLLPRLDAVGQYRLRGFGKDLFDQGTNSSDGIFSNAWGNLVGGGFQEWQLGFELSVPLGLRKGHVTVRNAELMLARDRAILAEQERTVVMELSNSIAEVDRAFAVMQTSFSRRKAAQLFLEAMQQQREREEEEIESLQTLFIELDAQRLVAEAEVQFFRALVEYELAVKNVHFEKGSLLEYNGVALTEGNWPSKAYSDALVKIKLSRPASNGAIDTLAPAQIVSEDPAAQRYGSGPSLPAFIPSPEAENSPIVPPAPAAGPR